MKRIIKIVAIFITLIIVNYNMCFADVVIEPMLFGNGELSEITALILPLIFILGIILIIIEIVTYICKKKKSEERHKIESIIYKTAIFLALLGSIYIFLYLFFYGGVIFGPVLLIGSIVSIIARKKKHIKLANIICGLVIIFSIASFFYLNDTQHSSGIGGGMQEVEKQQFNQKFMQYEGYNIRGGQVNALLQVVVANNMQEDDPSRKVEVHFSDNCKDRSGNTIQKLEKDSKSAPKVITGYTYKVSCNISDKEQNKGLVESIEVICNENNQNVNSES